jgi:hypothetical protein
VVNPLERHADNGGSDKSVKPFFTWMETFYPFYKDPITSWEYWLMVILILYWPIFGAQR